MNEEERLPYSRPAIVYEGKIEARAGSLSSDPGQTDDAGVGVDPLDLFGTGN